MTKIYHFSRYIKEKDLSDASAASHLPGWLSDHHSDGRSGAAAGKQWCRRWLAGFHHASLRF